MSKSVRSMGGGGAEFVLICGNEGLPFLAVVFGEQNGLLGVEAVLGKVGVCDIGFVLRGSGHGFGLLTV